ncbi:MAG: hypothetical protein ACI9EV_002478 [Urechidicola sp.]|jgi:hypothetical protein
MKKAFLILSVILLSIVGQAQSDSIPDLEAYFTAYIVSDIDTSIS